MLPFKTTTKESETALIEDGFGNSIEIPKYGCLTYNEEDAISKYYLSLKDGVSRVEARLVEITILFRSRFKLPNLNVEEVAEQASTMPMIDRLYDFVLGERTRWIPKEVLLELTGEKAKEMAIESARIFSGIAATRADLETEKRWVVFASKGPWLDGFEIVKDFAGDAVGKSLITSHNQLTGRGYTGN
ncbi:MAG: hypothetical protein EAZ18_00180 [Oscillatoriales cyanobacterium]|nr:MAG: hypothetical protein EAZ18_00180 [Oscillatoriales cyanobacterium]